MSDAVAAAPAAAVPDAGATGVPAGGAAEAAKPAASAIPVGGTAAASTEAAAQPKFKVKVDGKEQEVTQDELIKGYQLESASRKRQQEAAEVKKSAEAIVSAVKAGDYRALKQAGLTDDQIEQLSIRVLSDKHQQIMDEERRKAMDPQQREIEDKLKEREQLLKDREEQTKTARTQQVQQAKQAISKAVIETLQEFPEAVRKNEALAHLAFQAWAYCLENPDEAKELGVELTPKGIAAAVRKRQGEIVQAMIAGASDDELAGYVPDSIAAKILAKRKAATSVHPSLTSEPQVRNGNEKKGAPAAKQGKKLRELTLGALGLKP